MEHYSEKKEKNEPLIHATIQVNPKSIVQGERN
jgi:hypothetical protein